ncbi:hypothetical protein [Salinicola rhizosphaerae]|uniref:Uncharacterized protein n=1 Tax=Salinicola rhizosphaerae TaxID=1443141 RepID=A0ABQ3DU78_9GAMM|nr:hypothetical protein [Salinicola rhizosphaerae]GHB12951.1 hypothetical protein GCM10009038_08750 [Salinicola rhizosphaerae]
MKNSERKNVFRSSLNVLRGPRYDKKVSGKGVSGFAKRQIVSYLNWFDYRSESQNILDGYSSQVEDYKNEKTIPFVNNEAYLEREEIRDIDARNIGLNPQFWKLECMKRCRGMRVGMFGLMALFLFVFYNAVTLVSESIRTDSFGLIATLAPFYIVMPITFGLFYIWFNWMEITYRHSRNIKFWRYLNIIKSHPSELLPISNYDDTLEASYGKTEMQYLIYGGVSNKQRRLANREFDEAQAKAKRLRK